MAIEVGAGTTLAFSGGGSTWSGAAKIRSIAGLADTAEVFDITDLSVANNAYNLKAFAQTIDHGPIEIEYFWDPTVAQPPINTTFTLTITWDTGLTLIGSGRIVSRTGGQSVSNEIRMGTITFQFDGSTGPTYDNTV
jgi:hypothetical protein